MKRILSLFFLIFLFPACKEKTEKSTLIENPDLYDIINTYIKEVNAKNEPPYVLVILEKTIPIVKNEEGPPVDLSMDEICDADFRRVLSKNNFNKEDIEFMNSQLCSFDMTYNKFPFCLLDSTRVSLPVMTQLEYENIFFSSKDSFEPWDRFFSKYSGCYLVFSNPIFNKDKSKVYFQTTKMCGRLWGNGEIVVMEKMNNVWKILYREETWVS